MRPLGKCCKNSPYCLCPKVGTIRKVADNPMSYYAARRTDALGKGVEKYGKAIQHKAQTWEPPKKIWTKYTKREHRVNRSIQKGGLISHERVSKTRFDYKPRFGTAAQERHFSRMPLKGNYSQVPKGNIALGRAYRYSVGGAVRATGKVLPIIGYGALVHAIATDKNPVKRGVKELITLGMYCGLEATKPHQPQAVDAVSDFWVDKYINWWASPLKREQS